MARLLGSEYRGVDDRNAAAHVVSQELRRYVEIPDPTLGFRLFNRKRREISHGSYGIMASIPTIHSPFLDHDLFDFLASVPQRIIWSGPLHKDVLDRAYPRFAGFPWAEPTTPVPAFWTYVKFGGQVLAYAASHNPAWLKRFPNLGAQWLRCATSSRYRRRNRWMTPARLLHLVLLDQLRRDPNAFANPRWTGLGKDR